MRILAALLMMITWAPAYADGGETSEEVPRQGRPYLGVQPNVNNQAPDKVGLRSKGAIKLVSWVGFQMVTQGGQVFIQSTEPPQYDIVPSDPKEVVVELSNSRLHSKNEGRTLNTQWFPTAVESVVAKQHRGNKTRVTIKLRQTVGYDLRVQGNYLFLDFRPPTQPIKVEQPKPKVTPIN